jgi:hypothetical protein
MSPEPATDQRCLVCEQTSQEIPLIHFDFRGVRYAICPGHLPVLIHDPRSLAGKLPGAESMAPPSRKH